MTTLPAGYRVARIWHADDGRAHPYLMHPGGGHDGPLESEQQAATIANEHAGAAAPAQPSRIGTEEEQLGLF